MNTEIVENLQCMRDRLSGTAGKMLYVVNAKDKIDQLVEIVIEATDPKMRVISRYKKKLRQPLQDALEYIDTLSQNVPRGFASNAREVSFERKLKLLSIDTDKFKELLENANEDTDTPPASCNRVAGGFVLLCMEKKQNNFLGVSMEGSLIKKDVLQTSVTFTDHRLLATGDTETDVRHGLMCCTFEGLLRKAQERLIQSNFEHKKLISRKNTLARQLHEESDNTEKKLIQLQLRKIDKEIRHAKETVNSPEVHLERVKEVLRRPENYVRITNLSLRLNNFGVIVPSNYSRNTFTLDYSELEIENSFKRAALVLAY